MTSGGSLAWRAWSYLLPRGQRRVCPDQSHPDFKFKHLRDPGEKQFLAVVFLIAVIEVPLVHILLEHFNGALAWVVTGLTLAGVAWIVAVFLAAELERCLVCEDSLHVNDGVFAQYSVSRHMINALTVKELRDGAGRITKGYEISIELEAPVVVRSLGAQETQSSVSLEVRDVDVVEELSIWAGVGTIWRESRSRDQV